MVRFGFISSIYCQGKTDTLNNIVIVICSNIKMTQYPDRERSRPMSEQQQREERLLHGLEARAQQHRGHRTTSRQGTGSGESGIRVRPDCQDGFYGHRATVNGLKF